MEFSRAENMRQNVAARIAKRARVISQRDAALMRARQVLGIYPKTPPQLTDGSIPISYEKTEMPSKGPESPEWLHFWNAKCRMRKTEPEKFSHEKQWEEFSAIYKKGTIPEAYQSVGGKLPQALLCQPLVVQPRLDMMEDTEKFMNFLFYVGGNITGAALVIPPNSYKARSDDYKGVKMNFQTTYSQQPFKGKNGDISQVIFHEQNKPETMESWFTKTKESNPARQSPTEVEDFWRSMATNTARYCKDKPGSLFDVHMNILNPNRMDSFFSQNGTWEIDGDGEGLRYSYVYMGKRYAVFSDHVEDFGGMSINYLHLGFDKYWRIIPPSFASKYLEVLKIEIKRQFPHLKDCGYLPLHKQFMVPDSILDAYGIPYCWYKQSNGAFIVTFYFAFHCGFSTGWNVAEATNFAANSEFAKFVVTHPLCPKQPIGAKRTGTPEGFDVTSFIDQPFEEPPNSPLFEPVTKKRRGKQQNGGCDFGTNTSLRVNGWVYKGLGEPKYKLWLKNRLTIQHPLKFDFEPKITVGHTLTNSVPQYPWNPITENLQTAFKIRGFFPDGVIGTDLNSYFKDIETLLDNLKAGSY